MTPTTSPLHHRRRASGRLVALAVTGILVVSAACSGDDGGSPAQAGPGPGATDAGADGDTDSDSDSGAGATGSGNTATLPTSPSDRIGCRVRISGDVSAEFTAKDDAAALTSDYYLSDEDLDERLGVVDATDVSGPTVAPPDVTAPPRAEGVAPLTAWFLLNCQGGDITLNIYSNASSTSDDVKWGKGNYDLATGLGPQNDPTKFSAFIVFGANPEAANWLVADGARLQIKQFDERGAAGEFEIPMSEVSLEGQPTGRTLTIEGEFDVTCQDGSKCRA